MAVIFAADDGIHGQELWITNGTAEGTRAIQPPALSNPVLLSAFTAVDDKFMFIGQSEHGLGLWQTDGTDEGTTELATVGPADATAFSLVEAGGKWFVTVVTGGVNELWITDGTSAGTRYLTDLGVRSAFHSANSIAATSNGKFVFSNADANGDKELWVTDGTTAGTQLLKDIGQGLVEDTNWPLSSEPKGFVSVNGNVVFGTVLSASGLYVSDGTVAGTQPITGFAHVALAGAQTTANSVIFLSFPRWSNTYEIWVTDGTQAGTQILKSLSTTGSSGGALVGVADGAFVTLADLDASNGIFSAAGLYFTDGTSAGTRMLLSAPVAAASDFTKLDQNYVFIGDGLWHTDLTEAGTQQISTVAVSRTWSIEPFAELDGKLIFAGDDGVHGLELWITDGTSAGTQLLKDINPGGSSTPALVAAAGGMVLFTADDGMHGADLWGSDGTETGTRLLKDINAAGDSWAGGFTYINIAPDDITIAYGWVPENSAAGTFAGNLRAVDFDLTDFDLTETHTYTLLDDAGGRFILEDNVVKTASSTAFDFEGVNSYTITVRATDQGGKSVEKQLVIAVADVNEAPTNIALSKSNIAEHAGSGTTVGILTAADFDLTDTHTFTLMTNAGGRFELHDDKLVVANGALLDYEQKASHTVTVRANDGRGGFIEKTFTISLDDVAAESFTGDPFANVFSGGAGNDSIAGGAGDDKIAGFGGADHLFGGEGADTLHGGESDDRLDGGPGIDRLVGGNGSDFYRITSGDVIIEQAGSGTKDRVLGLNMSFDLGTFAGGFIEQAVVDGLLNVKLTGNAAANALWGNQGANTLNGKLGLDYLVGGIGKDKFVFDTKLSTRNVDRIVDFEKGDRICLDNAIFSKLGAAGALKADFFRPHRADDRNDYIHYDKATGALFYDADGNGTGPGIKFAVVETKPTLTAADFLVI